MPSPAEARSSPLAALVERAVAAGHRHPWLPFALLVVAYSVAGALGWLPPVDWWGAEEARR